MSNYRNQDPYSNRMSGGYNDNGRPSRSRSGAPADGSQRSARPYPSRDARERREDYDRNRYPRGEYGRTDAGARTPARRDDQRRAQGNPDRMRHSTPAAMNGRGYDRPARQEAQRDPRRNAYAPQDPSRTRERVDERRTGSRDAARGYRNDQPIREPRAQRRSAVEARQEQTQAQAAPQQERREPRRVESARATRREAVNPETRTHNEAQEAPRRKVDFAGKLSSIAEKGSSAVSGVKKTASSAKARGSEGGKGGFKAASSATSSIASWAKKTKDRAEEKSAIEREELAAEIKAGQLSGNNLGLEGEKIAELTVWHNRAAKAFSGILTAGLILGLCFFLRPSVSQTENRELTQFPSFTFADFTSGAFTEGVSTWYADTYPFRDQLISLNQAFKGLYGFEGDTQMYGTAVQGDDIPDEAAKSTEKKDPVAPETYDSWNLEENIQGQIMQGLYVDEGSVYATYGFTQEAADDYVNAINGAADKLEGTTQVYSILIPNNSGVLLSKDELAALGGSNQAQAIQYYYDSYNEKVKTVPTMQPLLDHKDEYLYFRTDHHWTSLAAYYVYQAFCEQKGMSAHNIEEYEEQDFAPFLGSYYSQLQLESLTADPDTVQAWIPKGTNDMTYTDVNGGVVDWNVIKDVSEWDQGTQYNCFVGGDQPWAEIHNPQITDGSSCLIVKESYGNAFVPWLVDHYQDVYIVDFRYNYDNVVDICKEKEIDDLIMLNNISIIGSVDVAGKIASIL